MHQRKSKPITVKPLMVRLSKGSKSKYFTKYILSKYFFGPNNQHERKLQDFLKGTPRLKSLLHKKVVSSGFRLRGGIWGYVFLNIPSMLGIFFVNVSTPVNFI